MGGWFKERSSGEPKPPNRKLLPVGIAAISSVSTPPITLENRYDRTTNELSYVESNNPGFITYLNRVFGVYASNFKPDIAPILKNGFNDGAMYVHSVFRAHAADLIPTFIEDVKKDEPREVFDREIKTIETLAAERDINERDLELVARIRIHQLAGDDSEDNPLGKAILEQIHNDKPAFLVGAMAAYFSIKDLIAAKEKDKIDQELSLVEREFAAVDTGKADAELKDWHDPELDDLERLFGDILKADEGTGRLPEPTPAPNLDLPDGKVDDLDREIRWLLRRRGPQNPS